MVLAVSNVCNLLYVHPCKWFDMVHYTTFVSPKLQTKSGSGEVQTPASAIIMDSDNR